MKNKIKEKVLKEVFKTYGILPNQFIEIKHKKVGNTALNIELPLSLTADLTLAEVGKVIDDFNFDRIVQLIADSGIENQKEIDVLFKQELKQKLGIEQEQTINDTN